MGLVVDLGERRRQRQAERHRLVRERLLLKIGHNCSLWEQLTGAAGVGDLIGQAEKHDRV